MLDSVIIYFGKREFSANRLELYEDLIASLSAKGSAKTITIRDRFEIWYRRQMNEGNRGIAIVYKSIVNRLEAGEDFAKALSPFIPKSELMIIESGVSSGRIVDSLKSASEQKRATDEINSLVIEAFSKPASTVLSVIATSLFCGYSLWPEILTTVKLSFFSSWTKPLIYFEMFLAQHWSVLFIPFFITCAIYFTMDKWIGQTREAFDKIAPWSIYRDIQSVILLGVIGSLLQNGVEFDAALKRVQKTSSPWLHWQISKIRERIVSSGDSQIKCLMTGFFSKKIINIVEDASQNRAFDQTLIYVATESMPFVIKKIGTIVKSVSAASLGLAMSLIMYQVAVQQIGINQAVQLYMAAQR